MTRWGVLIVALLLAAAAAAQRSPSLIFGPPTLVQLELQFPYGIAVDDAHGRLLVADTGHHDFNWTPIADLPTVQLNSVGFVASRRDPAALTDPQAIAADREGNVYVVNVLAGTVKVYPWNGGRYGPPSTLCGTNATTAAGVTIRMPRDIAVGSDGAVYLLDSGNNRVLRASGRDATEWTVVPVGTSLRNPYGLDVDASGTIYIADTANHRIVRVSGGTTTIIGRWGRERGELRFPRDVEVDQHGRLFVADTFSHRVQLLASDGRHLLTLGSAPLFGTIDKLAIDSADRLFVVDSDNNRVVAYLGGGSRAPFDPFLRDHAGDGGDEPSEMRIPISSPDILVRHAPDVDLAAAARDGLESIVFQQPRLGALNYVYVAVRNRGWQPAHGTTARLYWYDPGSMGRFPEDWRTSGIYLEHRGEGSTPANALPVPAIPREGARVVGPFVWQPPAATETVARDGVVRLAVRLSNADVPTPPGAAARDSNDITERRVTIRSGPAPTGEQNTLLVPVRYRGVATVIADEVLDTRARELAEWVRLTSWGEATLNIRRAAAVELPHDRAHYASRENSVLIELATDALTRLSADDRALLAGGDPERAINRIILVTNEDDPPLPGRPADWATTGPFPYDLGGIRRELTVSVQGPGNALALWANGVSHQFGMRDLYPHENVTFPRPYADGWDNMAMPVNGVHPLIWSKELSNWVSSCDARIVFVPRPPAETTFNNGGTPIPLYYQETAQPAQNVAVAFGLTPGVRSLSDETALLVVEARKNSGEGVGPDAALPQTGVLVYSVLANVPGGQGPVLIRDHVRGGGLEDAAIPAGGTMTIPEIALTLRVQPGGTGGADYNLSVTWTPPRTDCDLSLRPGTVPWESPDIWVDGAGNGIDMRTPPPDTHELAVQEQPNRIYARVFNAGPAAARDVEVVFMLSEPYHTVGDRASFNEFRSVFIDEIPPNPAAPAYVWVPWIPRALENTHTCARVELRRVLNDREPSNDAAQKNLETVSSTRRSPYSPVDFPVFIRSNETTTRPFYFRVDGVPAGWSWSITPPKVVLAPGETGDAIVHVQPPDGAAECETRRIYVTGWVPRGDTLVRLGGATLQVALQHATDLWMKIGGGICDDRQPNRQCVELQPYGCTSPPRPNVPIVIRYARSDGTSVTRTVFTGDDGCYRDTQTVTEGNEWRISAEFEGAECVQPARTENAIETFLPDPRPTLQYPRADSRLCARPFRLDVTMAQQETSRVRVSTCGTASRRFWLGLQTGGDSDMGQGAITSADLTHEILQSAAITSMAQSTFQWKGKAFTAVGHLRMAPAPQLGQPFLFLDGIVTSGADTGARVRASVHAEKRDEKTQLVLDGVLIEDPLETTETRAARAADASAIFGPADPPPMGEPRCLAPFHLTGQGELIVDQQATGRTVKPECVVTKRWSRVTAKLAAEPEHGCPDLSRATFVSDALEQILRGERDEGPGIADAPFVLESGTGVTFKGSLQALVRGPASTAQSLLHGTFTAQSGDGRSIEGFCSISTLPRDGRRARIRVVLRGTCPTEPAKPQQ